MARERIIVYALIVRCGGESGQRIICDYPAEGASAYKKIAIEVAKSVEPSCGGELLIGVQCGKYIVHTLIGELRYVAVTLIPDGAGSASSKVALFSKIFLERVRCAYGELPILVDDALESTDLSAIDVSAPLKNILDDFNRYDIDAEILLFKSQEQLEQVRGLLMEGVRKLINRGERLEELVRKTRSLEITVRKNFRQVSHHRRTSRKKKKKKRIVIAAAVTASVVLIVTTVALTFFFITYIYIL